MALFLQKSKADAHWSKDYTEHLRTIHFALIIAAFTGILIARSPDLTELEAAQRDLRTITTSLQELNSTELKHSEFVLIPLDKQEYIIPWSTMIHVVDLRACGSETPNLRYPSDLNFPNEVKDFGRLALQDVASVQDLRANWDYMRCGKVDTYLTGGIQPIWHLDEDTNILKLVRGFSDNDAPANAKYCRFTWYFVEPWRTDGKLLAQGGCKHLNHFIYTQKISVSQWVAIRSRTLNSALFHSSCTGSFRECFPSLSAIATARPDYSLNELGEGIDTDLKQAREKQFEFLGIKAPSASESYWGVLAIWVILIYFWLHLRQLSPRIQSADSGLDVPWLGLYSSVPAYILVWISVLLLPAVAVALLSLKTLHYHSFVGAWTNIKASRWPASFLASLAFLSVLISIGCCLQMRRLALLASTERGRADDEKQQADQQKATADSAAV